MERLVHKTHAPDEIAGPVAPSYSHAVEVAAGARWLVISGQVGIAPGGTIATDVGAQAEQAWENIVALLKSAGMGLDDVVKVTTFVTSSEHIAAVREVRARYQAEGYRPASTFIVVAALVAPEYLVEIEAVAARA